MGKFSTLATVILRIGYARGSIIADITLKPLSKQRLPILKKTDIKN